MDELVLVLQRLALRYADFAVDHANEPRIGDVDGWHFTPDCFYLKAPNGIQVKLTLTESQLLRALLNKLAKICPYVELGMAIHSHPDDFDKHRVEVIISRLRSKVERETGMPLPLRSYRGVGYSLSCKTDGDD